MAEDENTQDGSTAEEPDQTAQGGPPPWERPAEPSADETHPDDGTALPSITGGVVPADPTGAEIIPAAAPKTGFPRGALIAIVLVLAIAGGAVALVSTLGSGSSTDIATVVPADVVGYLRISVDPPPGQRSALRSLFSRLSADRRQRLENSFEELLSSMFADNRSFSRDVRPWLGSQVALSAHAGTGKVVIVGTLNVTDPAKARAFLSDQSDGPTAVVIDGDVAYVADTAAEITAFRAAAARGTLAANAAYQREFKAAGGDGLAVAWVNGEQIGRYSEQIAEALGGLATVPGFDTSAGSGVFVLRATGNAIELVGHQSGGPRSKQTPGRPALLEGAPATVLGGISIFDLQGSIETAGAQGPLASLGEAFKEAGIDLERDLLAWLGGEIAIIATPLLEFGLIADVTDEAAYDRFVARLTPLLGPGFGLDVRKQGEGFTASGGSTNVAVRRSGKKLAAAFASSATGAGRLADGLLESGPQTLGATDAFKGAFGAPSPNTAFQLFVKLAALAPFAAGVEELSVLEPFEAAAMRVVVQPDGSSELKIVLTLPAR